MSTFDVSSLVRIFFRAANIGRSRSSILNPLQWAMAILALGMIACVFGHAPAWILVFFAGLLGLDVVALVAAFLYLMVRKPQVLRSETHDFKITELTQNREIAAFIQRRDLQIKQGLYLEVADASALKQTQALRDNDR